MRSGRLKTSLRKQFGENCNEYKSVERISLTNYSCNSKDTMFPQCQCRRPSRSPHACGLEAAFSSIRNKKTILLLLWFPQIPLLLQFDGPYAINKIWYGDEPEWRHREYEPTESSLTCRTSRWHIFQIEKLIELTNTKSWKGTARVNTIIVSMTLFPLNSWEVSFIW